MNKSFAEGHQSLTFLPLHLWASTRCRHPASELLEVHVTVLVLVESFEQSGDDLGWERRRHQRGDDGQVDTARAGVTNETPELLLELHDLLL